MLRLLAAIVLLAGVAFVGQALATVGRNDRRRRADAASTRHDTARARCLGIVAASCHGGRRCRDHGVDCRRCIAMVPGWPWHRPSILTVGSRSTSRW